MAPDGLAGKTVTAVAGELVIRNKTVPAGNLNAAAFIRLQDAATNNEKPNAQEMDAVTREPLDLAIFNDDRVLLRTILLGVVQENAVDGFRGSAPSLQEQPAQARAESAGDIEHDSPPPPNPGAASRPPSPR